MNLRFTKIKVIGSLVVVLAFWIYIFKFFNSKMLADNSGILIGFLQMHSASNIFSSGNIILFVIELIVVYLILSIFHRRRFPRNVIVRR